MTVSLHPYLPNYHMCVAFHTDTETRMKQDHPITGIPCFWIHPCRTPEAMRELCRAVGETVAPLQYLLLWLGIVGGAVGLALPAEMAMDFGNEEKLC